jgi:magnesium-transporting ATPase (P-type)
MFLGYYTSLFHTSVSPWTTLGPLALVVSISLLQEACSDVKRHRSDILTNYHPCVVLRRAEMLEDAAKRSWWTKTVKREPHLNDGKDLIVSVAGHDTRIAFETVRRMNIHAGDLVVLRNREMIPADLILLASANEGGNAYIETSSIDGETNLKLRNSPPIQLNGGDATNQSHGVESMKQAAERIANISVIGHPHAISALSNPANADECPILEQIVSGKRGRFGKVAPNETKGSVPTVGESATYIATLTSERPNTHVNNYIGKLTLPPDSEGGRSVHAPLNIENVLLRGAVLRNTEWIIGVVCFTGADTKLVMNSVATPSKFSQMDVLINRTVFLVLFIMLICVCSLGAIAVYENKKCFDQLWYTGFSTATSDPWPYFNLGESSGIGSPEWEAATPNWIQSTIMVRLVEMIHLRL